MMSIIHDTKIARQEYFGAKPAQVQRAARLTANQVTNEIHKELGGTIPKRHGTSITGFRRVRAKKTLAKARRKRIHGITWIGRNAIAAAYAGKPKKTKTGAKAGKYHFEGAFVARMKSGHLGIFRRIGGKAKTGKSKIEEVTVPLTEAKRQVVRAAKGKRTRIRAIMQDQLRKQLKKKGKKR